MTVGTLIEKLNSFETTDDLHGFFKEQGVRGSCRKPYECIISAWIATEAETQVCTTPRGVFLTPFMGEDIDYTFSPVVREFVINFDEDQYPDLVKVLF